MILLGVDPGFAKLGWTIMVKREAERRPLFVAGGTFVTTSLGPKGRKEAGISKTADKVRRVDELGRFLSSVFDVFHPSAVCHEAISLGMHQSTTLFDMGLAFGALRGMAASHGVPLYAATPGQIKAHLTGNKNATKDEVIAVVEREVPDVEWPRAKGLWEHEADAIGACLTRAQDAWRELHGLLAPVGSLRLAGVRHAELAGWVREGLEVPRVKRGEQPPVLSGREVLTVRDRVGGIPF